jgi:outer membrane biosynthesis protein TonB
VRNALIVLLAVALVLVGLGALNHSLAFDIDYVLGSWTGVSVFWVTAAIGAVLLLAGLVAIWFARTSVVAAQRKLEAELQSTYERLRAAEARVPAEPTPPAEPEAPPEPVVPPEPTPPPEPEKPPQAPPEPTPPAEPATIAATSETPPTAPH